MVVVPTYNEDGNVQKLVPRILKQEKVINEKIKILFVDDNSPDGTGDVLEKLKKKHKGKIEVIHRKKERGLGSAYVRGFKEALKMKSRLIFGIDADLSHDPKDIPLFLEKIDEGYDVVQGSRYVEGGGVDWNWRRILISRAANLFAIKILGFDLKDITGAYKAYRPRVLDKINLDNINSNGYSFFEEILYRAKMKGFKIGEVPIFFREREAGKSKLPKTEMFKFFFTVIRLKLFVR